MCALVVRLPFDCNARRLGHLEDAGAHFGRDSRIPRGLNIRLAGGPPTVVRPNPPRIAAGAGKAAPKVSFIGELPPLAAAVARRRRRSGCTILARCSFFRRSILTL